MTLDPAFILTNRIYEERATAIRKRIGRRLNQAELDKVWLDAAEQARCEIAQQQQVEVLGAAVDESYAPLTQCEQAHEAAVTTTPKDLQRGAHDLYEEIKARQEATQRILDRRAAAGMCDSDEMTATMAEARAAISAQIDKAMADTQAAREIDELSIARSNHHAATYQPKSRS